QGPVHLVGIGGVHMSAIGQLLMERGVAVSGSDLRLSALTEKLAAMGATISEGHAAENLADDAKLLVTTAAADDDNPEIAEARRRGIPVILRAEMVARLMEGKKVIAVAGAHGKTTTSSLIAFILSEDGRSPMYLLGGESLDLGGHASWGEGEECVVEADEYKRAFLEYAPAIAIITNVEPDHLDYYGTESAYTEAFVDFARRIVPGGTLLACWDDQGARYVSEMVEDQPIRVETYGTEGTRFWQATEVDCGQREASFTLRRGGKKLGKLEASVPGIHFVRNATAAAAVCLGLGVDFEVVQDSIEKFQGARRRFEVVGEAGGILVMDDYAHHPTEVRATIATARTRFPETRLIGVYQPHTYSRIAYLWREWTRCWEGLDELVVLETYAAREKPEAGRSAKDLAEAIESPNAQYAADFDDAARQAVALARHGDVIFTIGAGDVVEVGPRILELLR
ncbi:MAG TPA: UDP-N-acetylmuramate--L-alanine ligase, partial [Tepidiformaceae bacterium]|nr:UDP-N-acetylmuramate--L-alanine ligase [Tepidiformaceae bacterium]